MNVWTFSKHIGQVSTAVLLLAACEVETPTTNGPSNLPKEVAAIVAPNQDLSFVRLMPEDNCYWYRHRGPVETTMLPLRNTRGRPICVQVQEAPATS